MSYNSKNWPKKTGKQAKMPKNTRKQPARNPA